MKRFFAVCLTLLAVTPALAQDDAADYPLIANTQVLANSVVKVIQPGFADLAAKSVALSMAMDTLCAMPSTDAVKAADAAFAATVVAYGHVEIFKAGPLVENNHAERMWFWPDAKGIALRQVQQVLASADETATTLSGLRSKSVAVQGLGALEYVLYGSGAETLGTTAGDFRCRYGAAVAQAIGQTAAEMNAGWQDAEGIATHLMVPAARYSDYRTTVEAMEEIVGTLSHGVEMVRDTKLLPFTGRTGKPAPRQAPFWRSNLTMTIVQANVDGLHTLFSKSRIAQAVQAKDAALEGRIEAEFDASNQAIGQVTKPVAEALTDPAQMAALTELLSSNSRLQALLGEDLSAALSLSVGFSSLDGD